MKNRVLAPSLLWASILVASSPAPVPAWAPVPADVWSTPLRPEWASYGALLLEDRIDFSLNGDGMVDFTVKVRIFNEQGRGIASMLKLPPFATSVRGRVVYPDGSSTEFDRDHGLVEKTLVEVAGQEVKRAVLVPQGITSNCYLEVHWSMGLATMYRLGMTRFEVGRAYPIKRVAYTVGRPGDWILNITPGRGIKTYEGRENGFPQVIYEDVPPQVTPPFTLEGARAKARVEFYYLPDSLRSLVKAPPAEFWQGATDKIWKPRFERVQPEYENHLTANSFVDAPVAFFRYQTKREAPTAKQMRPYSALIETLLKDLPEGRQARARLLHERLSQAVANWSYPTKKETDFLRTRQWSTDDFDATDLLLACERRGTHSRGLTHLLLNVLWKAGVFPKLMMVTNRHREPFVYSMRSLDQFTWLLLKVEEEGKPDLWLDMDLRNAEPGLIPERNQGVSGIEMDTQTWKAKVAQTPMGSRSQSVSTYDFKCQVDPLGNHGEFQFQVQYSGLAACDRRLALASLEAGEQVKAMKTFLESNQASVKVDQLEVEGHEVYAQPVKAHGKGQMLIRGGRELLIDPFPLMPYAISKVAMPEVSPEQPFYLGAARTVEAISEIDIPSGYQMPAEEHGEHANEFGRVIWAFRPLVGASKVQASLKIEIEPTPLPKNAEAPFRAFAGWVEAAQSRLVRLEKLP